MWVHFRLEKSSVDIRNRAWPNSVVQRYTNLAAPVQHSMLHRNEIRHENRGITTMLLRHDAHAQFEGH